MDAKRLKRSEKTVKRKVDQNSDKFSSKKAKTEKVVHCEMTAETPDGKEVSRSGYNNKTRSRIYGPAKDEAGKMVPSGNVKGGPAFPDGTPNVDKIEANPKVQQRLSKLPDNRPPMHNCAEPHALENIKAAHPDAQIKANYTVEYQHGNTVVKGPCGNCTAAAPHYGEVPFAKYDGVATDTAIGKHVAEGRGAVARATRSAVGVGHHDLLHFLDYLMPLIQMTVYYRFVFLYFCLFVFQITAAPSSSFAGECCPFETVCKST
jgi:hypothetical protein